MRGPGVPQGCASREEIATGSSFAKLLAQGFKPLLPNVSRHGHCGVVLGPLLYINSAPSWCFAGNSLGVGIANERLVLYNIQLFTER